MALTANQLAPSAQRRDQLVKVCQSFPQVAIEPAGDGHIAFRANRKTFAYYLIDHHGDGRIAFCFKSSLSEQRRQVRDDPENFFVPAYLGSKGWIAIRLDANEVDWEIVTDFARQAYQAVATRKLADLVE
jgi:predicted DNA-binding protein (MmcQ/YjbR family)